jgi:type I restriction enzyme S subunit
MFDSELGEIPEGWRVGGLIEDKISKFVKTNIDQFDGSKDYVETSNVNLSNFVGNFEKITFSDRPSRANMQPAQNSFWFARMAESRKYLLFQDKDDIESKILSTGFAGIQSIKEYLYFYWCFILSDIFNVLKNQYAEGAVQVAISNSGIQRIKLALPPIEIAKEFTEAVGFCFEKISNNNSQIETLSKLRDTLLTKLMKGDIRVKGFKD